MFQITHRFVAQLLESNDDVEDEFEDVDDEAGSDLVIDID
jgi:hypothetical protein